MSNHAIKLPVPLKPKRDLVCAVQVTDSHGHTAVFETGFCLTRDKHVAAELLLDGYLYELDTSQYPTAFEVVVDVKWRDSLSDGCAYGSLITDSMEPTPVVESETTVRFVSKHHQLVAVTFQRDKENGKTWLQSIHVEIHRGVPEMKQLYSTVRKYIKYETLATRLYALDKNIQKMTQQRQNLDKRVIEKWEVVSVSVEKVNKRKRSAPSENNDACYKIMRAAFDL